MSLVLLAALTVLVVGYLLTPSIRDRLLATSPAASVGMWKRGMNAIRPDNERSKRGLAARAAHPALIPRDAPSQTHAQMRVHNGQRPVLIPTRPLRSGAQAAPFEEHPSNPWDVLAVPQSPAQRRQVIEVVLGALTAVFLLAGFFVAQLWVVAVVFLLLLLAYLALVHEVQRRAEEVERARKMARLRGPQSPSTPNRPRRAQARVATSARR